jgi:beta-lactamase class A
MKRGFLIAGTALGAAAVIAGVYSGWSRIQPEFKASASADLAGIQAKAEKEAAAAKAAKAATTEEATNLQAVLATFSAKYPGQFGIVATNLKTGASANVNANQQMVAASLYKLFVGYGIYKKIDAGQLKLTSQTKGSSLTIAKCLDIMITISDNDCGYNLGRMVGWAALDADLKSLGLTQTKVNNYISPNSGNVNSDKLTSPADVSLFLTRLYHGELLSEKSTKEYSEVLKATKMNTWLASGLPAGTIFGHKTGALYNLVHDAGIVYGANGDYLLVVMSRDWQNASKQPPPVFADISRQLWNFFNK